MTSSRCTKRELARSLLAPQITDERNEWTRRKACARGVLRARTLCAASSNPTRSIFSSAETSRSASPARIPSPRGSARKRGWASASILILARNASTRALLIPRSVRAARRARPARRIVQLASASLLYRVRLVESSSSPRREPWGLFSAEHSHDVEFRNTACSGPYGHRRCRTQRDGQGHGYCQTNRLGLRNYNTEGSPDSACANYSENRSHRDLQQILCQEHTSNPGRRRAKGHSQTHFLGPFSYRMRDDAVNSNEG